MFGFLPSLVLHRDAASFHHSILPFYSSAFKHLLEYRSLSDIYTTTNPFVSGSFLSVASSLAVFGISSVTGNWSWYVTLPSFRSWLLIVEGWIVFGVFCQYFMDCITWHSLQWMIWCRRDYWSWQAFRSFGDWDWRGITGVKADIKSNPLPLSGSLLTVRGSEDYRWIYVRKLIQRYVPTSLQGISLIVFNIVFISFIQNILLLLLTAPYCPSSSFNRIRIQLRCRNYLVMLIGSETPLNYQDVLCMTALITSISLETLADEQQWTYQNAKHAKPSKSTRSQAKNTPTSISYCKPEDLKRGFIMGGLFRYSRHPNFACEQANWYFFYVFGCIATVCGVVFVGSEL